MSMIGKWKIKSISTFDPEVGLKALTLDEIKALPEGEEKDELMEMANVIFSISETEMVIATPISADQIEAAKAEGAEVTDDGCVVVQRSAVKVEDGVFYYDSETEGTIMGEKIDSWQKLELDENGDLVLNPLMVFE